MKKKYATIITIILSLNVNAQNPIFQWVKGVNVNQCDIQLDSLNNIYVTGLLPGATIDFDPGPGVTNLTGHVNGSCFIAKYDPSGNYVWAYKIGLTQGYGIGLAVQGNYVHLLANITGTTDIDPGAGVTTVSLSASGAPCVIKFNLNGSFVWGVNHNTTATIGTGIAVDVLKNIHICGTTTNFNQTAWVKKIDANGNSIWANNYPSTAPGNVNDGNNFNSVDVDGLGNVYLVGKYNYSVPSFTLTTPPGSNKNFYLVKLNSAGSLTYVQASNIYSTGGLSWTAPNGKEEIVRYDGVSNSIVITGLGFLGSDFDFGAGTQVLPSVDNSVGNFMVKYNAAANFLWGFFLPPKSTCHDLSLDLNGNIFYSTGITTNTVTMKPTGAPTLTRISSVSDIVAAKYNPSGTHLWSFNLGGTNLSTQYSSGITSNGSEVMLTGFCSNPNTGYVDFDPAISTATLLSMGPIAKYADCSIAPSQPSAISGSGTVCSGNTPSYSVAAVAGATSYTWSLPGGWTGTSTTNIITTTASATSGNMSVTAGNACGSSPAQTLSVTVNTIPATPGAISGSISLCAGAGATNYSVATVAGATSYSWNLAGGWSGTSTTNIISATPGSSGTFTVSAINSCGMSSAQTLSVTVNALPFVSVNSGTICSGNSFTMVASGANTYTYSSGPVVSPIITSSYSVTGTSTAGCVSSNTAISNVTVNATPTISVNSGSICSGQSFTMVPSGANTYTYQGGSAMVSPTTTTSYTVAGTSTAGCVSTSPATSNLTVSPLPTISATTNNTLLCVGQSATLTASGANTYTWNPGGAGTSISVSPTITTTYSIVGTSTAGCTNNSVFTQSVSACTGIQQLANVNSEINIYPNPTTGEFFIKGITDANSVHIYNILGEEVASTPFSFGEGLGMRLEQPSGIYFIRIGNLTKKIIKD